MTYAILPMPLKTTIVTFLFLTPPPPTEDVEYEGFFAQDNFNHLEIFTTPTPEPDSAAMEGW